MLQRMELLPGVWLTAARTDRFKTGLFSINFLRPLDRREASANAMIPNVLMRGTQQHPDMRSLSLAMEELYGAEISGIVRKKGEVQTTGLFADYIEDDMVGGAPVFAGVVELTAEILLRPARRDGVFRAEDVTLEKENLRNAIQARINGKRSYAVGQMVKAMCAGEPYGVLRLGEEEDVDGVTPENLWRQYETMLRTSRVEICYFGRLPWEKVAGTFRTALKDLPRGSITAAVTTPGHAPEQVREITERLDVTQGKLCLGLRLGRTAADRDWPAMMVMNTVFGSGVTSKLFANVREKLSLCYYASSALEKHKGVMIVDSGIEFDKADVARREILRQLEDCQAGRITEEEMASAKKHLLSVWKAAMDNPVQMDEFCLGQAILNSSEDTEDVMAGIAAVRVEDAVTAARDVALDTVYFLKGLAHETI